MAFLELNNYAVPVAAESVSIQRNRTGRTSRSFGSTYTMEEKYAKRTITATTTPMTYADAIALEGLIMGRGHSFSFNDGLYSSRGLGPNRGYGAEWNPDGGTTNDPYVDSEENNTLEWTIPSVFENDWCVSVWVQWNGDWQGWVGLGNGSTVQTFYRWGLAGSHTGGSGGGNYFGLQGSTSSFNSQFDISTGTSFSLQADTSQELDDLQIFPYHPTPEMLGAWKNIRSYPDQTTFINPFSPLPNLYLTGDCIPDRKLEVFGTINDIDYVQAALDGSLQNNLVTIQFSLEEV